MKKQLDQIGDFFLDSTAVLFIKDFSTMHGNM